MTPFSLTPKQVEGNHMLAGPATHTLLRGGSRSGKTFLLCRATVMRALKAPGSTHAILRYRFNHLKGSVINDTMPKVLSLCFPGVKTRLNKQDWVVEFPNDSKILYGGLDDKERVEKILGQEHSTIYLEECSQISYDARNMAMTRLAQNSGLRLRAYYSANPPTVGHWTYRMFEQHVEPKSGEKLTHPENYTSMRMNPGDNRANLPAEYLAVLEALPPKDRRRFLEGEYLAEVEGALWTLDAIQREARPADENEAGWSALLARMKRVVVAVDPSGCEGPEDYRSDEIGIVVAGIDESGVGYVLDDVTFRDSPEKWARRAVDMFDKYQADTIIGERNFGGAMVESTIRTARRNVPTKVISVSRGKHIRAAPIAALYEQQKVRHVGCFPDLEEQLCAFSAAGYQGAKSPDRADAMVCALTELMMGDAPFDGSYNWV